MNSFTEENYLKTMYNLAQHSGEITVNQLSKELNIKMPTVTSMVKKLATKNYINYQSYKPITLTTKGKKAAALIIRKHRLTEMYLVEKMGFGWEEVHEIAEQVEHIHSPKFFAKMDELLDFPTVDPHGSPIPDNAGNVALKNYNTLYSCKAGDEVKLVAVTHSNHQFLTFLNDKKLQLNTIIKVLFKESFDDSLIIKINNSDEITLSSKVTERLLVERI